MKLYHSGPAVVVEPHIIVSDHKRTTDFGRGFYTTSDFEQAGRWAYLRRRETQSEGIVSIFTVLEFRNIGHA